MTNNKLHEGFLENRFSTVASLKADFYRLSYFQCVTMFARIDVSDINAVNLKSTKSWPFLSLRQRDDGLLPPFLYFIVFIEVGSY